MFGKLRRGIKWFRLCAAASGAYKNGLKEGKKIMIDKAMVASVTVWGVAVAQAGHLLVALASVIQGGMTLAEFVPIAAECVGYVLAAFGARRALGKLITNGK